MPETTTENKVNFGLRNCHYATFTANEDGTITFDTPIPIPGGVELTLDPRGDVIEFYADDMLYYDAPNNQGYEGKLILARIPDSFAKDCLGEVVDATSQTQYEDAGAKPKAFALLFEFDGDRRATRHALFSCTASRPSIGSKTKTQSVDPNTSELPFTSKPIILPIDGEDKRIVKHKTVPATAKETYRDWYKKVFLPGQATLPEGA